MLKRLIINSFRNFDRNGHMAFDAKRRAFEQLILQHVRLIAVANSAMIGNENEMKIASMCFF